MPLETIAIVHLYCDVCGDTADLLRGNDFWRGCAPEEDAEIPEGWRFYQRDLFEEWTPEPGDSVYAVCPNCDPAKACEEQEIEYDPEDWIPYKVKDQEPAAQPVKGEGERC